MKRSVLAVASALIAAGLVIGAGAMPATAASGDRLVTVSGRVTGENGKPVPGITVAGYCECDLGTEGIGTTSTTGRFSIRIRKVLVQNIAFYSDSTTYLQKSVDARKGTKTATGYSIAVTLYKRSTISGTLTDSAGTAVTYNAVEFYLAQSGARFREGDAITDDNGKFSADVPAGDYKIRFVGTRDLHYKPAWFGGASKADARVVSVKSGGSKKGINGVVDFSQFIDGMIQINGKEPIDEVDEQVVMELRDTSGVLLDTSHDGLYFTFGGLHDGTYVLTARPSSTGAPFFEPLTRTVTLADGHYASGTFPLVVEPSSLHPSSVFFLSYDYYRGKAVKGKAFRTTVELASYGDTAGGTVTFSVGGKVVATKTVPASGEVTFSTRFTGVKPGTVKVVARFSGTATVEPQTTTMAVVQLQGAK